jgi:hypothetical protein
LPSTPSVIWLRVHCSHEAYARQSAGRSIRGVADRTQQIMVNCRFGVGCTKANCTFVHPVAPLGTPHGSGGAWRSAPSQPAARPVVQACFYGAGCTNIHCTRTHTVGSTPPGLPPAQRTSVARGLTPCRFGAQCTKLGCTWSHPQLDRCGVASIQPMAPAIPFSRQQLPTRGAAQLATPCRFASRCTNVLCTYLHPLDRPAVCANGGVCSLPACRQLHPSRVTRVDALMTPPGATSYVHPNASSCGVADGGGGGGRISRVSQAWSDGRNAAPTVIAVTLQPVAPTDQTCPFRAACTNVACTRTHPPERRSVCDAGVQCPDIACPSLHPKRPNVCKLGVECTAIGCNLMHPSERRSVCDAGVQCPDGTCPNLHPKRPNVCKLGAQCTAINCTQKHPPARSNVCPAGVKCRDSDCVGLHPVQVACAQGKACVNAGCKDVHPSSRPDVCARDNKCPFSDCPFLHHSRIPVCQTLANGLLCKYHSKGTCS